MNIQLAILRACLADGCRVRLLGSEAHLDVAIDARTGERPRLRFGHLVALDLAKPPVILWGWQRARVLTWRGNTALALLPEGRLVECHLAGWLPEGPGAEPEAWITRVDRAWELHDLVVHSLPAHPGALIQWCLARPSLQHA